MISLSSPLPQSHTRRLGFTLIEVLAVIAVITLLLAILLPALQTARENGVWALSQNNMRQIGVYMRQYATENRDHIIPSQFDYRGNNYPGNVRSDPALGADQYTGTWSDIIWTVYEMQPPVGTTAAIGLDYRYDSPDAAFYESFPDFDSVLRSGFANTNVGWMQVNNPSHPGYFAANNFFDARPAEDGEFRTMGQIKLPARSMYLIDSFHGEIIEPVPEPFDTDINPPTVTAGSSTLEVDFRNPGEQTMMLFLDGHIDNYQQWGTLDELEMDEQVRIRCLHTLSGFPCS